MRIIRVLVILAMTYSIGMAVDLIGQHKSYKNIKKVNRSNVSITHKNRKFPRVKLSNLEISTLANGKLFYGCTITNLSNSQTLKSDQVVVLLKHNHPNPAATPLKDIATLSRDIGPGKHILVRKKIGSISIGKYDFSLNKKDNLDYVLASSSINVRYTPHVKFEENITYDKANRKLFVNVKNTSHYILNVHIVGWLSSDSNPRIFLPDSNALFLKFNESKKFTLQLPENKNNEKYRRVTLFARDHTVHASLDIGYISTNFPK